MTGQTPRLPGYIVSRDGDGWVAVKANPPIVLRGKNQAELTAARGSYMASLIATMRQRFAETDLSGYPRDGSPPLRPP